MGAGKQICQPILSGGNPPAIDDDVMLSSEHGYSAQVDHCLPSHASLLNAAGKCIVIASDDEMTFDKVRKSFLHS